MVWRSPDTMVIWLPERRDYMYASVVGIRTPTKTLDSEPVVPPVSSLDQGLSAALATESYCQTIPKIPAESKIRHPLRFFPNQNPPS
ncbi:hypothetical protein FCV25MIE_16499 [Fagus crenata]